MAQSGRAPTSPGGAGFASHFLSRAEVLRILRDPRFGGPALPDYRGDLQMHSEWSDGAPTLAEIADGCLARGYHYAAVTDHSHGLKIAGGMSMAEAAAQHAGDRRAQRRLRRTLPPASAASKPTSAPTAALDLSADEAAGFELVLAAPHSKLRRSEDQTARMLARRRQRRRVHVLAHPRGRITGSRAGVVADWDAVFAAAAERGVADRDRRRSRRARISTSRWRSGRWRPAACSRSTATRTPIVAARYAETAIAHARLAGIPPRAHRELLAARAAAGVAAAAR